IGPAIEIAAPGLRPIVGLRRHNEYAFRPRRRTTGRRPGAAISIAGRDCVIIGKSVRALCVPKREVNLSRRSLMIHTARKFKLVMAGLAVCGMAACGGADEAKVQPITRDVRAERDVAQRLSDEARFSLTLRRQPL